MHKSLILGVASYSAVAMNAVAGTLNLGRGFHEILRGRDGPGTTLVCFGLINFAIVAVLVVNHRLWRKRKRNLEREMERLNCIQYEIVRGGPMPDEMQTFAQRHPEFAQVISAKPDETTEKRAKLQLKRVIKLTGAQPTPQGIILTLPGRRYLVQAGMILESLNGSGGWERKTCFYTLWAMPPEERMAAALLYLWHDPGCFDKLLSRAVFVN